MSRDAPTFCDHCGLPVGAGGVRRKVEEAFHAFCCLGCSIAWRMVGGAARGSASQAAAYLVRICLGFVLTMIVMLIQWVRYFDPASAATGEYERFAPLAQAVAATPVMLVLGIPYLWNAAGQLRQGRIGADLLIALGILAGYGASLVTLLRGEADPLFFDTACGLATLVTVGRWLEASAKERATQGLRSFLSDAARPASRIPRPDAARHEAEAVHASDLEVGDLVRVLPGESIPADGVVVQGRALLDEAALTGEPLPRSVEEGATVRAPTRPVDGPLVVRVEKVGEDTLLAEVGRVLAQARAERAPSEKLADRIASLFVPAVLVLAGAAFAFDLSRDGDIGKASFHAIAILVVACPCALGIATPLAITTALGQLARRGILVRSGSALSAAASVGAVACDKTGTLTRGVPRLEALRAAPGATLEPDVALGLAARVEQGSESPWARAILDAAAARGLSGPAADDTVVHPGRGIEGIVDGRRVRVGSAAWFDREDPDAPVVVAVDGHVEALLVLEDTDRASAPGFVKTLLEGGVAVHVLSGDAPSRVATVAVRLGVEVTHARGGLLPAAKVEAIRELAEASPKPVAFVGDGINDAPALAAADLGIAVGSGTDLARETAGVSLLGSDLSRIPLFLESARLARRGVRWNLFWAFLYNVIAVGWAAIRGLPPVLAALAMVLSSLCVIGSTWLLRERLAAHLDAERDAHRER